MERIPFDEKPSVDKRIAKSELSEGMSVIVDWSPYNWAIDEGYTGRFKGKIVEIHEFSGDIKIKPENDERTLKDMGGNYPYVQGKAKNPDTPSYTDIGTGCTYYPIE